MSRTKKNGEIDRNNTFKTSVIDDFTIGEEVLMRQQIANKWSTRFASDTVKIIGIKGSMITIKTREGQQLARDAALFKRSGRTTEGEETSAEEEIQENKEEKTRRTRRPVVR